MIVYKKINKNLDKKNVLNHDAQEQKVNSKLHQKGLIKDLEAK